LHTDDLVNFAQALQKTGVKAVKGRLLIVDNGFPYLREIDNGQLPQANYNPAIAGVNLNLNRVQFEWARQAGGGYDLSMSAPGRIYRPQIPSIGMRVEERNGRAMATNTRQSASSGPCSALPWAKMGGAGCLRAIPDAMPVKLFR
jgi:D-alanyl-D-alanine carboxypeptidase/D-alanyl-D-alanine-endopeptidase (penicillin-binding protein 4)